MENNKSTEITFTDIFSRIFKHKLLVIVLTLIITIVGLVSISFLSNKNKEYYSPFTIEFPSSSNLTYPDGSKFQYTDIIELSNLKSVKEQGHDDDKDIYKDIDVEKMAFEGDISISQIVQEKDSPIKNAYAITVKSSYFKDSNVAKAFIYDLAKSPLKKIETIIDRMENNYEKAYSNLSSYDDKIALFDVQLNELKKGYDNAVKTFGNVLVNNKSLTEYKNNIENFLISNSISRLQNEISLYGYAYYNDQNDELVNRYKTQKDVLLKTIEMNNANIAVNQAQIKTLESSQGNASQISSYLQEIATLQKENNSLKKQVETLIKKIAYAEGAESYTLTKFIDGVETKITENVDNEGRDAFEAKLALYNEDIKKLTQEYTESFQTAYKNQSSVSFAYSSIIVDAPSTSIIIVGIGCLIVGLIVASAVALIVDSNKRKKITEEEVE